jgi:hypothetical protein
VVFCDSSRSRLRHGVRKDGQRDLRIVNGMNKHPDSQLPVRPQEITEMMVKKT